MGKNSGIQWTHHTFNPWEGCVKVSPGCAHCYAEARNERFHGGENWGPGSPRLMRSENYWNDPVRWNADAGRRGVRERVFCASLADVFEDRPELAEPRDRLFETIYATPHLDWLLLTKRPENMRRLVPPSWVVGWPPNVWAGTTVEDQRRADERIPELVAVPADIHFLSCEPLLEDVDLGLIGGLIDWVIAGGESGRGARAMDPAWVRSIRDQCIDAKIPFHFKQWGEYAPGDLVGIGKKAAGRELDGRTWDELPHG